VLCHLYKPARRLQQALSGAAFRLRQSPVQQSDRRHDNSCVTQAETNTKTARAADSAPKQLLTLDDRIALLRFMLVHRGVEERAYNLYRQGKVPGSYYDAHGQEAIPVGVAYALHPEDRVTPIHRDMGVHLIRGTEPARILGQFMGRAGGVTLGRDSSTSYGDGNRGDVGHVSALGPMACVAVGIATAMKMRRQQRCVATFFGDGASSRGDIHEAMNWAAVHRLPLIFVLEDNGFAYSTPTSMQFAVPPVERAHGYGFPGVTVDGNDVEAIFEAAHASRLRALAGDGPTFIACQTMRMHGHAAHDDMSYVPDGLLESWSDRDPIEQQASRLAALGVDVDNLRASVAEEIDAATEEALAMPIPDPADSRPVFAEQRRLLADEAPILWSGFQGTGETGA
jgi:TPP-dependent pyruvate/acetoin dehydrogenase alpha subunit